MDKIHVIARFNIREGKLDDFKQGAKACIAVTKVEPGALLYDWFIDEEAMECTVVETYQDSAATLHHVTNVHDPLSRLFEISDFSGEVFGNTSQELTNVLSQMNIRPVPFFAGL